MCHIFKFTTIISDFYQEILSQQLSRKGQMSFSFIKPLEGLAFSPLKSDKTVYFY